MKIRVPWARVLIVLGTILIVLSLGGFVSAWRARHAADQLLEQVEVVHLHTVFVRLEDPNYPAAHWVWMVSYQTRHGARVLGDLVNVYVSAGGQVVGTDPPDFGVVPAPTPPETAPDEPAPIRT